MLDSVFVGSKWINWLVELVIALHLNQRNQILFQYLRDKKKKKEGGSGVEVAIGSRVTRQREKKFISRFELLFIR